MGPARIDRRLDAAWLARVEDAGLNASAPPQQRWIDGWLVRFCPGKARRARCVQPVAPGRLPLADKLRLAAEVYDAAALPMVVRVTPFAQPRGLGRALDQLGWPAEGDTRVMVARGAAAIEAAAAEPLPRGLVFERVGVAAFAQAVGALRGSPLAQREAHAQRLEQSPVPFEAYALRRKDDGAVLACAQVAREADLVGLYDVFTAEAARGRGLARRLCARALAQAAAARAAGAYLQVDADNAPARAVYRRLGFVDGYSYHYRVRPGDAG
ncbi:MAG TPA: GNAT family N-acetyltransferase [Burkholderiaceae bacterium]|nr:GNAT family N-acetyltransferase [Burkholderiaceae bacterium]